MSFYLRALRLGLLRLVSLPRLTLPVLITLSTTLAAVLTVVAMSSNLVFKPLPDIKDEQSLYLINRTIAVSQDTRISIFTPNRAALLAERFSELGEFATYEAEDTQINVVETTRQMTVFNASDNLPKLLGSTLLFGAMPDTNNSAGAIWISETLWEQAFNRSPNVLNENIVVAGKASPIRGIFADFNSLILQRGEKSALQLWQFYNLAEQRAQPTTMAISDEINILFFQKSAPFTTADMDAFWSSYLENEAENLGPMIGMFTQMAPISEVTPYRTALLHDQNLMLLFLLAVVLVMLLMASLNLLNLFIAHAKQRDAEMAMHYCLGASKTKIFIMLFLENTPVFVLSASLGLLGTAWFIRLLPLLSSGTLRMLELVHLDIATVVIAFLMVLLINAFFASIAAAQFKPVELVANLNNSSNKGISSTKVTFLSKALFIIQLSSASIVLTGTAMLAQAAYQKFNVDFGFAPKNTAVVELQLNDIDEVPENIQELQLFNKAKYQRNLSIKEEVILKLSEFPNLALLQSQDEPFGFSSKLQITEDEETNSRHNFLVKNIAPDYLNAFSIKLIAGRNITESEYNNLDAVALINETFAKAISQHGSVNEALGKTIAGRQIVGIIQDHYSIAGKNAGFSTMLYAESAPALSSLQLILQLPAGENFPTDTLETRLSNAHPLIKSASIRTLQQKWQDKTRAVRIQFYSIMVLSSLTLLLAAIGSQGMAMSFTQLKRFELAVRMATGATRLMLLKRAVHDFSNLLTLSAVSACSLAALLYVLIQQQVPTLPPFSWQALGLFNSLLFTIVTSAIILVVWRIINLDPMLALREQ